MTSWAVWNNKLVHCLNISSANHIHTHVWVSFIWLCPITNDGPKSDDASEVGRRLEIFSLIYLYWKYVKSQTAGLQNLLCWVFQQFVFCRIGSPANTTTLEAIWRKIIIRSSFHHLVCVCWTVSAKNLNGKRYATVAKCDTNVQYQSHLRPDFSWGKNSFLFFLLVWTNYICDIYEVSVIERSNWMYDMRT